MEAFSNIQAITFDVGGTLIEPWPSVGHVYAKVAARHGFRPDPEQLNRRFAAAWRAKGNFDYSRAAWATLVAKAFVDECGVHREVPFFDELYDRFSQPQVWRIYDDVLPALAGLSRRGFKLGVISNWDERLRPLLRLLDLDRFFAAMIISNEIGCHKPSAQIFQEAVRQLATPTSSILHIGDSSGDDVEGARAAGFSALQIQRSLAVAAPGRILSLRQLESLTEPGSTVWI
ncbi:MAG: HAD-IA family hydrolase [Chloroflexi bacterium]|nr:HAD-IA family hydrolase [Chloroflexota bacterium]